MSHRPQGFLQVKSNISIHHRMNEASFAEVITSAVDSLTRGLFKKCEYVSHLIILHTHI